MQTGAIPKGLSKAFRGQEYYRPGGYDLLPFRFLRFDAQRTVATNLAGEHILLENSKIESLIEGKFSSEDPIYAELISRNIIAEKDSTAHLDLLAAKYRTRLAGLKDFTSLHLFIVTLRCDHSCQYCQVSRVSEDREAFDMSEETANRAIDFMFQSPSPQLKVEFQGGEPLLNFGLIEYILRRVAARKGERQIQFVITSNLANLTDRMIDVAREYGVFFSTSIDGPEDLHNGNRPRPGHDSYAKAVNGIEKIRLGLGEDRVSALMTTTAESLEQPEAIIDEYVKLGFREIFLRHVSPYGFAVKTAKRIGYETSQFITFYQRGLKHILELNTQGIHMREIYSSLILKRMLTPYADGYVDLQSPAGMGLMVMAYNYNGDVYSSDEGRMLAEMGDHTFRLGNLQQHSFQEMIFNSPLLESILETMVETIPQCSDCAFVPWCGTDPVFHHRTQGNMVGHRPTSAFCQRNMAVMKHLVSLLEDEPSSAKILKDWVR